MRDPDDSQNDHERQLDGIIARYYEGVDNGQTPNQALFIAQHPDFAAELREFFSDLRNLPGGIPAAARSSSADEPPKLDLRTDGRLSQGTVVRYFGNYEVLEELGAGGMGIVFKARHKKLDKIIAIKMFRTGQLANEMDVERFRKEAKAAARLNHTGIVAVHEVGVHRGRHYFTMDYMAGGSLAKLSRDEPVPVRRAADLLRQLAQAVQYAHGKRIIHRDLKPANILLTDDGIPRITDFGLAKQLRSPEDSIEPSLTETGQIMGTAGYMPPEQASGKKRDVIGPAADIYSLGAVLYAMLTSRAPFVGESTSDTLLQVLYNEPVSPRLLNPNVPRDLETICLKCLQKKTHERYGTADLLAEDLKLFLEGRPIKARPVGPGERCWRWCRRNPVVAGLIASVALSLIFGIVVSSHFARESDRRATDNKKLAENEQKARREAEQKKNEAVKSGELAEQQRRKAEASDSMARRHLYISHMNLIQATWEDQKEPGQLSRIANLLARHVPEAAEEDLRSFEWYYWNRQCKGPSQQMNTREDDFKALAYHPDGEQIAGAGSDMNVRIWDARTGKLNYTLEGHTDEVRCLSFNSTGSLLASGSTDNTIIVWDCKTHKLKQKFPGNVDLEELGEGFSSVSFSPDDSLIASASDDGTARLWDAETGRQILTLGEADSGNGLVAFSGNGRILAYVRDTRMEVWEIDAAGSADRFQRRHSQSLFMCPTDVACNWDGSLIVLAGLEENSTLIYDVRTNQSYSLGTNVGSVECISFTPDGRQLVSGDRIGQVKIWDLGSGTLLHTSKAHSDIVSDVCCSPHGPYIASASSYDLKIWDPAMARIPEKMQVEDTDFDDVGFSPDSSNLASCGSNGVIAVWDLKTGDGPRLLKPIGKMAESNDQFPSFYVEYNHDGTLLAAAGGESDFAVYLRQSATGQSVHRLEGHTDRVTSLCFSPNGCFLASGSADGCVNVWNVKDGALAKTLKELESVAYVSFSHDGKFLGTASAGGRVTIREADTYRLVHTEEGMRSCVAFSPTERVVAYAARSGLRLLNLDDISGSTVMLEMRSAYRIAFSPDGQRIAATSSDGMPGVIDVIRIWDTQTGEEVLRLAPEAEGLVDLEFSRDGSKLVAATVDRKLYFGIVITQLMDISCGQHVRCVQPYRHRSSGMTMQRHFSRLHRQTVFKLCQLNRSSTQAAE